MTIIFYTYLIPRFNFERERRLFNNFLNSMYKEAWFVVEELDRTGKVVR